MMKINSGQASWIPLWTVTQGDTVAQSLPSGRIEDLSHAVMTTVKALCTFECPDAKMDLLQIGEAYVTAHHHKLTNDGWMTARQASLMGQGKLWTNQDCLRVYSWYLAGGGNIMISTTAPLQKILTQLETATVGCRFETSNNPNPKDWLKYPDSLPT